MPFEDATFEVVVSTFSMHHSSDPTAGLGEIACVLRPDGRALIWDLNRGFRLFHVHAPDPVEQVRDGPLRLLSTRGWQCPWRFVLAQRVVLARSE